MAFEGFDDEDLGEWDDELDLQQYRPFGCETFGTALIAVLAVAGLGVSMLLRRDKKVR